MGVEGDIFSGLLVEVVTEENRRLRVRGSAGTVGERCDGVTAFTV